MAGFARPPIAGHPRLMREINEAAVLGLLRRHGELSRTEVARLAHLSHPTVTQLLDALEDRGLVRRIGTGVSQGGRKPALYAFNPDSACVIGVDVGSSKMAGGVIDLAGTLLAEHVVLAPEHPDPEERLCRLIDELLRRRPPGRPVRGIGLGVAGVIDLPNGIVTLAPGLGWFDFPLGSRLVHRFGLPVYLDNDVNAILLGEHWLGAARGRRHALCLAVGTGIGAALLVDGRLHRGTHGAAGEVGYVATSPAALARRWKRTEYGSLESLAAGPGIERRAREALASSGRPSALRGPQGGGCACAGEPAQITARAVFEAAAAGDALALEIVAETALHLASALAGAICLLDPEVVVLTGGVMRAGELLAAPIRRHVEALTPYLPEIVLSTLGLRAGVLGAAALVLEEERQFPGVLP